MNLPEFSLVGSDEKTYSHTDFAHGTFVFYIYPKDMTSGCTRESQDFRDALVFFREENIEVFGVSGDGISSHQKFCAKESLPFVLLADEEHLLMTALGAWKEKNTFGKKYMGAERSTFLIQDGVIFHEWRKVKVSGHVDAVLSFLKKRGKRSEMELIKESKNIV